jgi:N-sulfoglucosamine sulfohydrolase
MISTSMAWGLRWPTVLIGLAVVLANASAQEKRPNILLALADDWNWPHSETADVKVVRTPVFDRVCREGVRFSNAYVSSPSCTSSRCAILTGQWHWRLEEAANLGGQLQEKKFPVYPELLGSAGYHVGMLGKGPDSRGRDEPPGPRYKDFDTFMAARPADKPFVLWFGSRDPHRPYQKGGGIKSGMKPEDVQVPACLPDSPEVRSDLCDYYLEIQRFDAEVGDMIRKLELAGELENTIMVMTGDNGLPFPRCKSNLYDTGAKVPLAIRWGSAVKGARVIRDFVSLADLAPTFLEAAGIALPPATTAHSLIGILRSDKSGQVDPARDHILTGKERHCKAQEKGNTGGYPCRAIRTEDFLYIRNFEPGRWPAGIASAAECEGGIAYHDIDVGPSKSYMITHRDEHAVKRLFDLGFGKRPSEELYDLAKDPGQLINVAADPSYVENRRKLAERLMAELTTSQDPRTLGEGGIFDHYPKPGR